MSRLITLERNSPVPLYYQIAQQLEQAIEDGHLPPGTRLDNELALADELHLSRPTLRRAMQYLVDRGLLVRRRGVGTRVVQPKVRRPLELSSLFEDLTASGQRPSTKVILNEVIPATEAVATTLGIAVGADVVHLERLRSARELPIARLTNYLPAELIQLDSAALEQQGLYQLMRTAGVRLHSATQTIGARNASAAESRLLGEARGAALLTMQRTTYDDHAIVVEFGMHVYVASRYSFELSLLTH